MVIIREAPWPGFSGTAHFLLTVVVRHPPPHPVFSRVSQFGRTQSPERSDPRVVNLDVET